MVLSKCLSLTTDVTVQLTKHPLTSFIGLAGAVLALWQLVKPGGGEMLAACATSAVAMLHHILCHRDC